MVHAKRTDTFVDASKHEGHDPGKNTSGQASEWPMRSATDLELMKDRLERSG